MLAQKLVLDPQQHVMFPFLEFTAPKQVDKSTYGSECLRF